MREAYLTIDDSPSPRTDDLIDALLKRGVPAILYCRGDLIEANPDPIIRAIQKGFVIGNHGYQHKRASQLGYEGTCKNIDRADALIADCYKKAGQTHERYYRFAYIDRGMGAWFIEPDSVKPEDRATIENIIKTGLGNDPKQLPSTQDIDVKRKLQAYLRARGYRPTPFKDIAHPFYAHSEMATAIDAMFTFSNADWSATARHGARSIDDLKKQMDADPHLRRDDTAHIVLAHDQEEIHDVTIALVDHMLAQGFIFNSVS